MIITRIVDFLMNGFLVNLYHGNLNDISNELDVLFFLSINAIQCVKFVFAIRCYQKTFGHYL